MRDSSVSWRRAALACAAGVACFAGACGKSGAGNAQRVIVQTHGPAVARTVIDDLVRHRKGLQQAADRLAGGFVKVSGEQQAKEMRWALKRIHEPPKGIPELVVSPMSFMAAVDMEGSVIARDAEPDHMRGMDLAAEWPAVRSALAGDADWQIGEFQSLTEGGKPSVTILLAAPARLDGKVVGALTLGIPLWRLAQRLSRQLQLDHAHEQGVILWAYVYRGDVLHHHGTPPDLDTVVPDGQARRAGLARSPGGFTGELAQFGRWYAFGVRPLQMLGDDIGVIIFRSDPI